MLQSDVMRKLLEDWYGSGDPAFLHFVETYALGKSDYGIEDVIFQVWRFSQSHPWPEEWLSQCEKELEEASEEQVEESLWMEFLIKDIRTQAEEMKEQLLLCVKICEEEDGPASYRDTILEDAGMMEHFQNISDYRRFYELLTKVSFGRLPAVRKKEVDPEKKSVVTAFRGQGEKNYKGLEGKLWKAVVGNGNPDHVGNQGDNGAVVTIGRRIF